MAAPSEDPALLPDCPAAQKDGLLPVELRAWMVLLAATGAIEQRLGPVLKESLGVSHDEFLVLCLLADRPDDGLRMTRIAELLGRPKTRLTYQIACLSHTGLVTRRSVCGDKRGVEVALTDKGRRLFTEVSPALADTINSGLDRIGPEEREALYGLLPEEAGEERGGREELTLLPRPPVRPPEPPAPDSPSVPSGPRPG
ncbi:MarR family winged helix-turn-helix transcriptional regulator [Streptomyces sp. ADMS]|nr:MarR family winged helix-turn-helix transcriptional regulator [Streptomyces sp. ADMS]MDW4906599.1 MarR family winged helix-turn-helix transcriptional regulator [Streptomyces sp. ADMS]